MTNSTTKSKITLMAAIFALSLNLTGCGGNDEEKATTQSGGEEKSYSTVTSKSLEGELPAGHPPAGMTPDTGMTISDHSTIKSTKDVKLDDDVLAKWNEVKLQILDSEDTTKEVQTIKVGDTYTIRQTGFAVKVLALAPDYTIFEDHIGSRSNENNNPAVLLELTEGGKIVAKGWVFNKIVGFDSFKNPRISVKLLSPSPKS